MAIIWRVVSAIMAFIFFITGTGSLIGGTPVYDIEVFDFCMEGFLGQRDGATRVFYTYGEWQLFCKTLDNPKMVEYASNIEESLFDEHNLILVDIECSASNVKVKIANAMEDRTTLNIDYLCVDECDMVGATVMCYNTVFATTSKKYISNVELNEIDGMTVPFLLDESVPNLYRIVATDFKPEAYDENFDKASYLFTNYADYKDFVDNGQWKMSDYIDIVDEKYFETKNLVIAVFGLADGGDSLRISYPVEDGNTLKFKGYTVSQPVVATGMECEEAVFIETSKVIESVEFIRGDREDIPFCLDGSNPAIWW